MPTPFMHLQMAEKVRHRLDHSSVENGRFLANQLDAHWPAFYLGNIAPDFSAIAPVSREQTHFYHIPLTEDANPMGLMLQSFPPLANSQTIPSSQRLFLAGYLAHLLYDVVWYRHLLTPFFLKNDAMGEWPHRRVVHFLLQTRMDNEAWRSLAPLANATLCAANPQSWLPFGTDADLVQWRDMVAMQLLPDTPKQTSEIYAKRVNLPLDEYNGYLNDPIWMADNLFQFVPPDAIDVMLETAVSQTISLLTDYLQ